MVLSRNGGGKWHAHARLGAAAELERSTAGKNHSCPLRSFRSHRPKRYSSYENRRTLMRPERSTKTSLCGATIKKVKCQDQQFYSPQSSLTCTPPERERITPCVRLIADNHGHYPQMPVRSITEPGSEIQCIHIFFACTSQKEALKSVELGCRTTRYTGQRLRLIRSCRLLPSYIILHQRDQSANMIFVPKSSQAARPHSARGAAGELGR